MRGSFTWGCRTGRYYTNPRIYPWIKGGLSYCVGMSDVESWVRSLPELKARDAVRATQYRTGSGSDRTQQTSWLKAENFILLAHDTYRRQSRRWFAFSASPYSLLSAVAPGSVTAPSMRSDEGRWKLSAVAAGTESQRCGASHSIRNRER